VTGLELEEFKELLAKMDTTTAEEDDFDVETAYEAIEEPNASEGTIYTLGKNLLLCDDSTNLYDVFILMHEKKGILL